MKKPPVSPDEQRRRLLRGLAAAPVLLSVPGILSVAGCAPEPALAADGSAAAELSPTPACEDDDDDDPKPAQTEGPYFTRNSPERASLLTAGMTGTQLVVTGLVVTRSCAPVANALLDFWQCDADGNYDNAGYTLRGHQFTDTKGAYRLETIVPGLYPGRTRHIHVKVQAPGKPVLTTQLYFLGESRNQQDRIYREECLVAVSQTADAMAGKFNFVLDLP